MGWVGNITAINAMAGPITGTTNYTLDYYLEGEHLESVERLGTLTERYFRGSTVDELVAGYVEQGGKQVPYFFQHDHLMGVVAQTKPNGGTQATMAYRPFGEQLAETGTPVGRQRYTGREDDGTGLMYYRARYYDPGFGGFISEDPLKFQAGPNFYAYVDNNPVNFNDPSGLAPNPITAFIRQSAEYLGIKASGVALQAAKDRGVAAAWKMEQQLVRETGAGTRVGGWTSAQVQELLATGKVRGFVGDHINSANGSPTLAGLSDNIQFSSVAEHAARHSAAGGTQVPVYGALLDRTAGGALPRLADGNGYSIKGTLLGAGAAALGFAADAAEAAELFMPSTYMFNIKGTGGCNNGVCSDMINWNTLGPSSSSGAAGGGFLLYPNKANTNMMQSVYSK